MYQVGLAPGYPPVLSPEAAAALGALPPSSVQAAAWYTHYLMLCSGGPLMHPLVTPMLAGQPPPIQPPKLKMEESPPEDVAAAAILHGISPRPRAANDVTSAATGAAADNAASQAKSLTSPRSIFPNMQLVAQAGVVHPQINVQRQGSAEQPANVAANATGAAAAPAASRPSSSDEDEGIVLSVERAREITERPITIELGTNQVVGQDPERILAAYRQVLSGSAGSGSVPPLWDGSAAQRIVEVLGKAL